MRADSRSCKEAGHEVINLAGAPREKLVAALADADALLVRSATKVDKALLDAAPRLIVVGRAGVGVDNVDVPAATARGVLVINAPTANVVSAVEHTFALLFSLLRRVPAAASSMASGKWEKCEVRRERALGKDPRHHRHGTGRLARGGPGPRVRREGHRPRPVSAARPRPGDGGRAHGAPGAPAGRGHRHAPRHRRRGRQTDPRPRRAFAA